MTSHVAMVASSKERFVMMGCACELLALVSRALEQLEEEHEVRIVWATERSGARATHLTSAPSKKIMVMG